MQRKDFSRGNTSWEHFCNRLGAGSLSHRSLLRTTFAVRVATRFLLDSVFLQGSQVALKNQTFLPPKRWTLKFWEVNLGTLDEDGFAKLSHESFVVYLRDVGSAWVGTNAWYNKESCSGKIQNRDVWDRVWGFVVYLRDVDSGWVGTKCVLWDGELFR